MRDEPSADGAPNPTPTSDADAADANRQPAQSSRTTPNSANARQSAAEDGGAPADSSGDSSVSSRAATRLLAAPAPVPAHPLPHHTYNTRARGLVPNPSQGQPTQSSATARQSAAEERGGIPDGEPAPRPPATANATREGGAATNPANARQGAAGEVPSRTGAAGGDNWQQMMALSAAVLGVPSTPVSNNDHRRAMILQHCVTPGATPASLRTFTQGLLDGNTLIANANARLQSNILEEQNGPPSPTPTVNAGGPGDTPFIAPMSPCR